MRALLFLLASLLLSLPAAAEPDSSIITGFKTRTGMKVVSNLQGHYWTLDILGRKIETGKSELPVFEADGKVLQILMPAAPPDPAGLGDPLRRLIAQREQMIKQLSNQSKHQLRAGSMPITLADGTQALLITLDLPPGFTGARSRLYLTRLASDYVLMLGSAVTGSETVDSIRAFLIRTMESAKLYDQPIDLDRMRKELAAH